MILSQLKKQLQRYYFEYPAYTELFNYFVCVFVYCTKGNYTSDINCTCTKWWSYNIKRSITFCSSSIVKVLMATQMLHCCDSFCPTKKSHTVCKVPVNATSELAPHLPVWHTELADPHPLLNDEHSSCKEKIMKLSKEFPLPGWLHCVVTNIKFVLRAVLQEN